ncbi:SufE family protein [Siculibacillus lacustris]|uniref:SufE family protein n=1 Tax=Siculibacillus lacustris TaxID=1549641 RepID=UPI001D17F6B6|nr:SufE family protein [Siculibacillus lacustris]
MPSLDDILSDFDVIDDWEERYRYLIELGRGLPPLDEAERTDANKVRGCASQVWLSTRIEADVPGDPRLWLTGDSDAHIVKGLVAVILAMFSGRRASEILALDPEPTFAALHLREHLTPQRANGVASMIERIRHEARTARAGV